MPARTPPLLTPERLQRLSGKQFKALQAMVEAEDQRRFTAHLLRAGPTDALTAQEARTVLVQLGAEQRALLRHFEAMGWRLGALDRHRRELELVIKRAHVEPLIGQFVAITDPGTSATRLHPKAGDIGRLLKVEARGALMDFGDELRTWYIPLSAVGDVKDPLADDRPDHDGSSREIGLVAARKP